MSTLHIKNILKDICPFKPLFPEEIAGDKTTVTTCEFKDHRTVEELQKDGKFRFSDNPRTTFEIIPGGYRITENGSYLGLKEIQEVTIQE